MTRRFLGLLLACAACLAVSVGAAVADNPETIRLRVPVKLKKMLAEQVSVVCSIRSGNMQQLGGSTPSGWRNIVNGEFDQVVEVAVTPLEGKTFAEAKNYRCTLSLKASENSMGAPAQGTPPYYYLPYLAKPDEFFRAEITGPLDGGGKVVDGIVGPKDLTVQPKQKQ